MHKDKDEDVAAEAVRMQRTKRLNEKALMPRTISNPTDPTTAPKRV